MEFSDDFKAEMCKFLYRRWGQILFQRCGFNKILWEGRGNPASTMNGVIRNKTEKQQFSPMFNKIDKPQKQLKNLDLKGLNSSIPFVHPIFQKLQRLNQCLQYPIPFRIPIIRK